MSSPRPPVDPITDRVYAELPGAYQDLDEAGGWPLLSYVSAQTGPVASVDVLVDRLAGGELADPQLADPQWLPWLAAVTGVVLPPGLAPDGQRALIAAGGRTVGSKRSIAVAAQTVLTGTQSVRVVDHYGGDPWTIGVVTVETESPPDAVILAAIAAAGVTPLGFRIVMDHYLAAWSTIEADLPTWAAREAAGSWAAIESEM